MALNIFLSVITYFVLSIVIPNRSTLLERMPVFDEATYSGRRAGSLPSTLSHSTGTPAKIPNGVVKPSPAAPLVDLLDLGPDDTAMTSSSGNDFLNDLLGVDLSSTPSQPGQSVFLHFPFQHYSKSLFLSSWLGDVSN